MVNERLSVFVIEHPQLLLIESDVATREAPNDAGSATSPADAANTPAQLSLSYFIVAKQLRSPATAPRESERGATKRNEIIQTASFGPLGWYSFASSPRLVVSFQFLPQNRTGADTAARCRQYRVGAAAVAKTLHVYVC